MSSFMISSHTANVVYHPQILSSRISKGFFESLISQGKFPSVVSASVTISSEQGTFTNVIDFHVDEKLVDHDALLGSDWSTACNKADCAFLIDAAPVIEKDTRINVNHELDTSLCSPCLFVGSGFGLASCMQRVLCVPELLRMVFNMLDQASIAVNAQVCQQWCNLALDILWKNVNNPYLLFRILAPLEKAVASEHYEFQKWPSSHDWKRFLKYSTKVRSLSFRTTSPQPLLASVLETISATRTTLNIFPNLHTLLVEAGELSLFNLSVIFMHANIKNLALTLPSNFEYRSLRFVFEEIHSRIPDLTNIHILSSIPMHVIETDMIALIAPLLKLKKIIVPRFYLTSKFTEALSRLPALTDIQLPGHKIHHGDPVDVKPFTPQLTYNAFPNLSNHSMTTSFHDATHFLQTKFFPTKLQRLYIESDINETPPLFYSLLTAISESCQNLECIRLVSYPSKRFLANQSQVGDLTIDILKPLVKLSKLVFLQLIHQHPLALNQMDIELLASSWPLLRTLKLNYCPIYHTQSSLTLEALVPFAKYCPELQCLGLFIDASEELIPRVDLIPFQNLKYLNMGVSSIIKTEPVAFYLSVILPLTCRLAFTARWDLPDIIHIRKSEELRKRWDVWSKVGDLLLILWNARKDERERTRYLLQENDSKLEQPTVPGRT